MNTQKGLNHYNHLTTQDFQNLVSRAQSGDRQAIDELCVIFKPLVVREARKAYIRDLLGEDAVNDAWVAFLELVMTYQGTVNASFPGLVKQTVYCELLHKAQKALQDSGHLNIDDRELVPETADEDAARALSGLELRLTLRQLLTKRQLEIIQAVFFEGKSLAQIALTEKIRWNSVAKIYCKALKKMIKALK